MSPEKTQSIRYAVPTESVGSGALRVCAHFGHCEMFALIDADPGAKTLSGVQVVKPPPHEPGLLPRWLAGQGVNIVLTGGMGWRAIEMFQERGIDVVTGVTGGTPEQVILAHLSGTLSVTDNTCDH